MHLGNQRFGILVGFSLGWMAIASGIAPAEAKERAIPAFTAYSLPDANGLAISEKQQASRFWPGNELIWYGQFKKTGDIQIAFSVRVPKGTKQSFQVRMGKQLKEIGLESKTDELQRLEVGSFSIPTPGYIAIGCLAKDESQLKGLVIHSLLLDGNASDDAHFNLEERRNAASVHLMYPTDGISNIDRFYLEVTGKEDPENTFYMACGFHRGYFGMQVNSAKERRIIFSVWDSGKGAQADRRDQVDKEHYVQLIEKGPDVHAEVFGNEGTGGHSHLKYMWKTGEPQKFLVVSNPKEDKKTEYAGFYYHPEKQEWVLISRMLAPHDGTYLRGLHSFSENFWGSSGHIQRKALYGPQWVRSNGEWIELTQARFSHDPTGKENRLDRFMGVEDGQFLLSHGGFVDGFTQYGQTFDRPKSSTLPKLLTQPLPE